jgi:hypothetical protein
MISRSRSAPTAEAHVGEQNRHLLVLRPGVADLDWRATAVAKPGVL